MFLKKKKKRANISMTTYFFHFTLYDLFCNVILIKCSVCLFGRKKFFDALNTFPLTNKFENGFIYVPQKKCFLKVKSVELP